jgi:hypothetical protein
MKLTSSQVWTIVGLASLVWLGLSILGVTSGGGLTAVFSLADIIPALLVAASIHERWLWRQSLFHRSRVITTPVVIGTWRGQLESFWQNPETGERPPIKTVYLTIQQTATTVSVRLLTNESSSEQLAGTVTESESGYPAISYNYRNRPDMRYRKDGVSPIHYGGAVLEIVGDPATGLNGEYWTDRNSRGEFKFREQSPRIAQTFEEAESLTFGPPRPYGVLDGLRGLRA